MATSRSASLRLRRHAARPRGWAQLPWTLLGMAFVTALFLLSYQLDANTQTSLEIENPASYSETDLGLDEGP